MKFSRADLQKELVRFNRRGSLLLPGDEIDEELNLPLSWTEMLTGEPLHRTEALKSYWQPVAKRLSAIIEFIEKMVHCVAILAEESGEISLIYVHSTSESKVHFYQGFLPLEILVSSEMPLWDRLPNDLQEFYRNAHNGWTYLVDNAMGPLPIGDLELLTEKLDLDEDEISSMPISPDMVLPVFHNGSGDFLCLDLSKSKGDGWDAGILWWHEKPTEPDAADFWAVMNSWIEIFLENCDVRQDA